jgi:hypothetical protein
MEAGADVKDTGGGRVLWPINLVCLSGGGQPEHRGSGQHTELAVGAAHVGQGLGPRQLEPSSRAVGVRGATAGAAEAGAQQATGVEAEGRRAGGARGWRLGRQSCDGREADCGRTGQERQRGSESSERERGRGT